MRDSAALVWGLGQGLGLRVYNLNPKPETLGFKNELGSASNPGLWPQRTLVIMFGSRLHLPCLGMLVPPSKIQPITEFRGPSVQAVKVLGRKGH